MANDYNNKKYYWLKLQRDFFKRHDIKIIEDMDNGKDYILFYLKLLCESIDHQGNLRFSDTIPYNEKMLASVTNTNIDIVRSALNIFTELKMIDLLDDKTIYMNELNKMIGCETQNAIYRRKYRKKERLDNVQQVSNQSPIEIEIEKDIEIDKKESIKKKVSHLFTPPSLDEVIKFADSKGVKELGTKFYEYYTTGDRDWIDSKGNKVRNWKQKLLTWINYNSNGSVKKPDVNIKTHDYTAAELGALFDNINDFDNGGLVV